MYKLDLVIKFKIALYMRNWLPQDRIAFVKDILIKESTQFVAENQDFNLKLLRLGNYNSNDPLRVLPIVFSILKTRGLTRFLTLNYLSNTDSIFGKSYEINRIVLLQKLLKYRKIVKRFIREHLRNDVIPNYGTDKFNHLYLWNYVNPDKTIADGFDRETILWKEYGHEQFASTARYSRSKFPFVVQLLTWNLKMGLDLIYDFELTELLETQIRGFSPETADLLQKRIPLRRRHLEHFDQTFDDCYMRTGGFIGCEMLSDVQLWHQRFVIKNQELYLFDAATKVSLPFVAGQWQFIESKSRNNFVAVLQRPSESVRYIESGFLLSGRADENWYHLLMDTIPRMLFSENIPESVPFIIRADLPETSKEFIRSITYREIVEVSPDETLRIGLLYLLPARSTALDSRDRSEKLARIRFSPHTLESLRDRILQCRNQLKYSPVCSQIMFNRKTKYRVIINMSSLTSEAIGQGVDVLNPDQSFYKLQDKIFGGANLIIAPGGAIFANILFMKPGSTVICLQSWRGRKLGLWRKLCEAMGVNYHEINGIPTYFGTSKLQKEHSNFYIFERKFAKILGELNASRT